MARPVFTGRLAIPARLGTPYFAPRPNAPIACRVSRNVWGKCPLHRIDAVLRNCASLLARSFFSARSPRVLADLKKPGHGATAKVSTPRRT